MLGRTVANQYRSTRLRWFKDQRVYNIERSG